LIESASFVASIGPLVAATPFDQRDMFPKFKYLMLVYLTV